MASIVRRSHVQGIVFFLFSILLVLTAPVFAAGPAGASPAENATSGPRIWLQANQPLPVQHVAVSLDRGQGMAIAEPSALSGLGQAQPVSLAADDLEGDGIDDLIVGYSVAGGGFISVHSGNLDAFAPQSEASAQAIAAGRFPSPFLLEARTFSVPVSPDFMVLGDFTGSGGKDLAIAAKGGNVLYVFRGDGKGNFSGPQTVNLPGGVTALATGRFGSNSIPMLFVGLAGNGKGFALALYVHTAQGLSALASYPLAAAPTNILMGEFGDPGPDAAFLSGGKVQILRSGSMRLTEVSLPVTAQAMALGGFIHDRNPGLQIALLGNDGSIQIAVHQEFDPRPYTPAEMAAMRKASRTRNNLHTAGFPVNGWKVVESFPGVASVGGGQSPLFFRTRVSSNGADDVMLLNPFAGQLVLLSHEDVPQGAGTFTPGRISLRPYSGTPVAAMPLRINVDNRPGVISLHQGEIAPSLLMPIPDPTFFPNRFDDPAVPVDGSGNPQITTFCNNTSNADTSSPCSLRDAIIKANMTTGTDTVQLVAGTYTLSIPRVSGDFSGKFGTLEITDSINIMGAVDGSGNPASIIQAGTSATNGVDKILSINQDISTFPPGTTASASLTNLVLRFGFNRGDCCTLQDGFGGAFDFDVNNSGATVTVMNCNINNNSVHDGQGGAITVFNTGGNASTTGLLKIMNSVLQNNSATPNASGAAGDAGALEIDAEAHTLLSNTQILNNHAIANAGTNPTGGGIRIDGQSGLSARSFIHGGIIQGNTAAGDGGGIHNGAALTIDQGAVIEGNSSGGNGGGINNNNSSPDATTLMNVTIAGNTATGNGGGIFTGNDTGAQPVTMTLSRIAGNTASSGSNLFNDCTVIANAADDWWGTNNPATTIVNSKPANCPNTPSTTFDPFIVLTHTAAPQIIKINTTAALTGDMSHDNHGAPVTGSLSQIAGLSITFDNPVLGAILETQPETLNSNAQATATFRAGNVAGSFSGTPLGSAHAVVDGFSVAVNSNAISMASETGTTATITTVGAHGFSSGEHVIISGVATTGYNTPSNQFSTITSVPSANTFTYTTSASNLATATGGGTVNAGIIILQPPSISKSFSPTAIQANVAGNPGTKVSTLTFSVTNGNVIPIDANFTDTLPTITGAVPGSLVIASTPSVVNTCGGTVTATAGSGTISFSTASLAVGTCTIAVNVQSTVDNVYSNSVTIDSTAAGNNPTPGTANLTVINPPHISKSFAASSIPFGATTGLSFMVSNPNAHLSLNGIGFTDTLPTSLVVATPNGLSTTCTGSVAATAGSGSIALSGASLSSGASCTVSVNVQGVAVGMVTNTVTVSDTTAGTGSTSTASITITKADSATALTSTPNPSVFGQSVTFTAMVSAVAPGAGTPTGSVTFFDGATSLGSASLVGGVATLATSSLAVGSHTITATYGGDNNFNSSPTASLTNPQVVNPASTTTGVTSSPNPSVFGQTITFTATVAPVAPGAGTPTGSVTFMDGGSSIGSGSLTSGVATLSISTLSTGSHTITTLYNGDGNFSGSSGALPNPQVVNQSATSVSVSASPTGITLGDTVTLTATVTASSPGAGTPSGLVTFFDGVTPIGSGILNQVAGNDQATFTTLLLSVGSHSITAIYDGGANFSSSPLSAAITETVQLRTSTTAVSPNPTTVVVGQPSTATITVTDSGPTPVGTVDVFSGTGTPATGRTGFTSTLFEDGKVLIAGGTDANGTTVLQSAEIYSVSSGLFTPAGNLTSPRTGATATLLPNGKILIAGGSSDGTANGALNSAELFDPNTGAFAVTSGPMTTARFGATATLLNNGKVLLAGGANTIVLNSAEIYDPATDTFTATGNLNSARTGSVAVLLGTGKVLIAGGSSDGTANGALNSAELFDPAGNSGAGTFTASVSNLAAGRWQPEAALLLSGKALLAGGQDSSGPLTSADLYDPVADSFTPSAQNMAQARANGSAVALSNGMVLLAGGTTSTVVELYDADSDRFDATGSLQQSDNGLVSTLLNNGQVLVVGLTSGATPQPDAEIYSPSFNPLGTVGLSSSEATDAFGGACVLTPGTGTDSTCTTTVTPSHAAGGSHTITGSYPADAVHSGVSNTASLTVGKADTTTAVTSTQNPSVFGQPITFTATVTPVAPGAGTPTGTVTFLDGSSAIGCSGTLVGGVATCTPSTLSVGNHTITTTYTGDGNFNGSPGTLNPNPQVVNQANTSIALTSSQNPSTAGQSVTFTATVSAVSPGAGTPTGTVTFFDGTNNIGNVSLTGGVATLSTSALGAGSHTITAQYGGDANFQSITGSLSGNPQVVSKGGTTTTVTSSQNSSQQGQAVTFTAAVSPVSPATGTPTGTVSFLDNNNPLGNGTLVSGVATFTTSTLVAGNHTITTSYSGDSNFNVSSGSLIGNPQVVVAPPSISKSFSPNPFTPSASMLTLTFTITNPAANTVAETGVAFVDNLLGGLVIATPNGLTTTCGGTTTANAGTSTISLTGGSIAIGSNCTITVGIVPPGGTGSFPNTTGAVSSTNGGTGNTASDTLTVASPPTISKAFSSGAAALGTTVGLSFSISNPNPSVTLTGIQFTDPLPAGLQVANPSNVFSDCGGTVTAVPGSSSISLSGGIVAPAGPGPQLAGRGVKPHNPRSLLTNTATGQCTITVNLSAQSLGQKNNTTGIISAKESGPGGTSNTATLNVIQPLTVSKAFGAASVPVNGTTSLTFNFANPTTTTEFVNVALTDPLPAGLAVASPNGVAGTCVTNNGAAVIAPPNATSVLITAFNMAPGDSCTATVNVAGLTPGVKNNTTMPVTASFDDGSGNFIGINGAPAPATINVQGPPLITEVFNPQAINPTNTAILSFTLANPPANPAAQTGVAFTDTFPANLTVASPANVTNTCGGSAATGTNSISLTGGTIPIGASCTVSLNVTAAISGVYTNITGPVSSTNGGTGATATASLVVQNANLTIAKTHSGNFASPSTSQTYTLVVSNGANSGPTVGTVSVVDNLPSNTLTPTAIAGTGWNCTLNSLTCTRNDSLAANASYPPITLTVNVPAGSPTSVTNSATVSGGGDPNSHTANDPTTIVPPAGAPLRIALSASTLTINVGATQFVNLSLQSSPKEGTVQFSCSGLPFGASCNFNPPSTSALTANVALGISTTAGTGIAQQVPPPTGAGRIPPLYGALLSLLGLAGVFGQAMLWRRQGKAFRLRWAMLFAGMTLAIMSVLIGCGGMPSSPSTPKGSFPITVTAKSQATGDSSSAIITVVVPQ